MCEFVQVSHDGFHACKKVVSDLREDTAVIRQSVQCLKGKLDDLCALAGFESPAFIGGGNDSDLQHALNISLKECLEARDEGKRVRCSLMRAILIRDISFRTLSLMGTVFFAPSALGTTLS